MTAAPSPFLQTQNVMYDLMAELQAQHEELEARLTALEARLDALGTALQALPRGIAQAIRPARPHRWAAGSTPSPWPPMPTWDYG